MGNHNPRCTCIQGCCKTDLIVLGNSDHDQRFTLGVVLGGMDGAEVRDLSKYIAIVAEFVTFDLLMEGQAIEHSVFHINPYEIRLCGGNQLQRKRKYAIYYLQIAQAPTLVTKVLGIPWPTPNSVFVGSSFAIRRASRRFPGWVKRAARNGALT
jgi:hypothetical protein